MKQEKKKQLLKKALEYHHGGDLHSADDIYIEIDGHGSLNDKMRRLTTVEDARQSLENIFKNNIDKPNNP